MTLEQLRYLVVLAEEGNFTQAAERLFLTQPALSVQIRRLEEELKTRLFDRNKRPLEPTEAGRAVVAQARRVLEEVEKIKLGVNGEAQLFQGPFRVGVIPTLAPYLLPRLLPRIIQQWPQLELSVREELTPDILRDLLEGRLDAGLIGTAEKLPGLEGAPLFEEPFIAYVSCNHPLYSSPTLHPLEIPLEDTWILAEGHCFRQQVLSLCRPGVTRRQVEFQSGDLETLMHLVEEMGGITLLPEVALWTLPQSKRSHLRPLQPRMGRTVYLIHREGALKRPVARALGDEVKAIYTQLTTNPV
ncbi:MULTISPECIES: LysR family transcriptional regulator [unclassified Meiothermus]|uniref:LysR family transcriptional regulator n=1 Tax=unclassified Meiothermus TaxID=370471 RepID=UPI000D7C6105|nr:MULTISPECIES: hydrogen peroxide-inducible genes activator [unclassified Meiothermus]PZA06327.1 hydrogen peroxide-inducible genes activator [Meiothermus sp. Pnk-1]RYM35201.1 hydrogen peroxide-inducible genes activator [Meiothermus sp. PNK-Is4]